VYVLPFSPEKNLKMSPSRHRRFHRHLRLGEDSPRSYSSQELAQERLVNEVKSIYTGLAMVEKKCIEVEL
jgi:hypothetical protein